MQKSPITMEYFSLKAKDRQLINIQLCSIFPNHEPGEGNAQRFTLQWPNYTLLPFNSSQLMQNLSCQQGGRKDVNRWKNPNGKDQLCWNTVVVRIGTNFMLPSLILAEYYPFGDLNWERVGKSLSWSSLSKAKTFY